MSIQRGGQSGLVSGQVFDTVAIDVPSIAAATGIAQALAVPGVEIGDQVVVTPLGTWLAGLVCGPAQVLAADVVTLQIANVTAGALDLASQQFRVTVGKLRPQT